MCKTQAQYITYEQFGAVGDGIHNDFKAIVAAHDYANSLGLPVKASPSAIYRIGSDAITAIIRTPTDWSTAQFIIDDTRVENYTSDIFSVEPSGTWHSFSVPPLKAGQTHIDTQYLQSVCDRQMYVTIKSNERMQYIRYGGNQDSGSPQTDSFILTNEGDILSGINWNYSRISECTAVSVDEDTLEIRGGIFITVANQAPSAYTYFARGINVHRSHTVLEGVSHTVNGEGEHGAPYRGFFSFENCAYITMKNCHVTGHKIYNTIGSAGKSVPMGSYDINCYAVIDIRFIHIRQDDILNQSLWGVFGSNFCKEILFDGCVLSRSDAHCGVRDYTIRNSVMGWMGTNTIGFGEMLMENCLCFGRYLIGFREDYGCSWDGNLTIKNVTWIPTPGQKSAPTVFHIHNQGNHDFGYPCTLPHRIVIERLTIVDTTVTNSYDGIYIFEDFHPVSIDGTLSNEPYPLERPKELIIRNLRTISGLPYRICRNSFLFADLHLTDKEMQ